MTRPPLRPGERQLALDRLAAPDADARPKPSAPKRTAPKHHAKRPDPKALAALERARRRGVFAA
jgi:hypothetical protein